MLKTHLLQPLLGFMLIAIFLEFTHVDLWLADAIYHGSGDAWRWRDAWVTAELIHKDGRSLVGLMVLALLLLVAASYWFTKLQPFRRGLWYVLGTALFAGLLVNVLKRLTHVDCPWDLQRYGGTFEYLRTFAPHLRTDNVGECFPAGHASAGYSWFGLYFFARHYFPRWCYPVLAVVLVLGLVFGIGQQLRGAHFLSHDVWTLGLCWFSASLLALLCLPKGFVSPTNK